MALALEHPIASQSSSEVIMEKTKDGDTIRIFGRDKPAQQKDFQSSAPVTDNSKHSDEELIEISDDKMNSRQLMVAYGELGGKIFILDNGDIVAEVRDSGFYDQLGLQIDMSQFRFEHTQEGYDWLASINQDVKNFFDGNDSSDASLHDMSLNKSNTAHSIDAVMSKVKRRRIDQENLENPQTSKVQQQQHAFPPLQQQSFTLSTPQQPFLVQTSSVNQFQSQFEEELKKYACYQSQGEEIDAKKLGQMLEGICGTDMKSFDPKMFAMMPMERQILLDKVKWKLGNRLWKVPYVSPPAYGEKLVAIRNTVEDAGALQHVFLDLMYQIALGRSDHLTDKLVDGYKLALLATGDAQRIREQTTGGAFGKPDKSEILSETTKQKMNEQRKIKKGNFNLPHSGNSRFNSSERVTQNQNSQRKILGFPRQKGVGLGKQKGFKFNNR
ncbi:MAG: hypothetical protein EZS28_013853 [Streblomastix strix]|uniref:Uncharacterized protein n=1 Tax=Streblomastix strix TaxID=222440 RepID=A0A5J4W6X7_9EUKA|nr:MAG: hypothetical protein EZS28_013853 [Streblomastix strix]